MLADLPPLEPTTAWEVRADPLQCLLTRSFGDPAKPVTISLRPFPTRNDAILTIVSPEENVAAKSGTAELRINDARKPQRLDYRSNPSEDGHTRITKIGLPLFETATVSGIEAMAIKAAPLKLSVKMSRSPDSATALDECQRKLRVSLGLVPDSSHLISHPRMPRDFAQIFVRPSNYPPEALTYRIEGEVRVVIRVGADGRPKLCRPVLTVRYLADATCRIVMQDIRFTPATDATGPVDANFDLKMRWALPPSGYVPPKPPPPIPVPPPAGPARDPATP